MVNFLGTKSYHKKYETIGDDEALRAKGFIKLKEYEYFWLCAKLDTEGNVLFRECFSKWDLSKNVRGITKLTRGPSRRR